MTIGSTPRALRSRTGQILDYDLCDATLERHRFADDRDYLIPGGIRYEAQAPGRILRQLCHRLIEVEISSKGAVEDRGLGICQKRVSILRADAYQFVRQVLLALLQRCRVGIDQEPEAEGMRRHDHDELLLRRIGEGTKMYSSIQTGQAIGMQTLDQCLADMVKRNIIAVGVARNAAQNKDKFQG